MDQDAYRKTYQELNERYCIFEKGILTNQCGCSKVRKLCIAEREAAHCKSDRAQKKCIEFLAILKEHARFALKLHDERSALPHAKAIKLQIGGLRGLQMTVADPQRMDDNIQDVAGLLDRALEKYTSLDNLPFPVLIKQVAAYQGRVRRRNKPD